MQKTFNVWVRKNGFRRWFTICSKKVTYGDNEKLRSIKSNSETINGGAEILACDVSQWLDKLNLKEDEVRSFKLILIPNEEQPK